MVAAPSTERSVRPLEYGRRSRNEQEDGTVESEELDEEEAQRATPKVEPEAEDLPQQEPDSGPPPEQG